MDVRNYQKYLFVCGGGDLFMKGRIWQKAGVCSQITCCCTFFIPTIQKQNSVAEEFPLLVFFLFFSAGQPHQNRVIFGLWMYKVIFLRHTHVMDVQGYFSKVEDPRVVGRCKHK